jgi:hypothetical protein
MAKLQFASAQRCLGKGKGSVRECSVQVESLISIGICSRHPGQHILVKQCLVGASSEPFTFQEFLVMIAATGLSAAAVCFFSFDLAFNAFKSFIPFSDFFTSNTNLSDSPKQFSKCWQTLNRMAECHHLWEFVFLYCQCRFCWRLFTYGYTNMSPTSPRSNPVPPPSSGLW